MTFTLDCASILSSLCSACIGEVCSPLSAGHGPIPHTELMSALTELHHSLRASCSTLFSGHEARAPSSALIHPLPPCPLGNKSHTLLTERPSLAFKTSTCRRASTTLHHTAQRSTTHGKHYLSPQIAHLHYATGWIGKLEGGGCYATHS